MHVPVPKVINLLIDNVTSAMFVTDSIQRTKLKWVDLRLEWCRMLKDQSIVTSKWIPTTNNVADLLTKITTKHTFETLRDQLMHRLSHWPNSAQQTKK